MARALCALSSFQGVYIGIFTVSPALYMVRRAAPGGDSKIHSSGQGAREGP